MKVDSLGRLKTAFRGWRSKKRHVRETVPEELMERACRAAAVHGVGVVARATMLDQTRLGERVGTAARDTRRPVRRAKKAAILAKNGGRVVRAKSAPSSTSMPAFSRIELPIPQATAQPLAEVETPGGVKLRVFAITPETVSLLSTLSGPGRAL
jgi:hypothetical protein